MSRMFGDVSHIVIHWDVRRLFEIKHDVIEVTSNGMEYIIHYNWQSDRLAYFMEVKGAGWQGSTWLNPMDKFDTERCDQIAELLIAFCG